MSLLEPQPYENGKSAGHRAFLMPMRLGVLAGQSRIQDANPYWHILLDHYPELNVDTFSPYLGVQRPQPVWIEADPQLTHVESSQFVDMQPKPTSGLVAFFVVLMQRWNLDQSEAAALLGFTEDSEKTIAGAVLRGDKPLEGRDLRDRISYLFQIHKTLTYLFRDLEVENQWLREAHQLLDGNSPMQLMLQGSMEGILLVKEYVNEAAGR